MRAFGQLMTGFCDRKVALTGGKRNERLGDLERQFGFSGVRTDVGSSALGLGYA